MKQQLVLKVSMNGDKSRSKALKVAVGLSGVESASLKGDDKSQIEVTGDGVDAVKLASQLRKSVGFAELVSVSAAGGEKKEEKKDDPKPEPPFCYVSPPFNPSYHYYPSYEYVDNYGPSPPCSIM